jgi:hypothetical protein
VEAGLQVCRGEDARISGQRIIAGGIEEHCARFGPPINKASSIPGLDDVETDERAGLFREEPISQGSGLIW